MNVLVVAAHPDDDILGCGGTIARHAARGDSVHIHILGEGITSRYDDPRDANPDDLATLKEAGREAARRVGARSIAFHDLPDNRFDTVPLLDIIKLVERAIADTTPELVYTQSRSDLNVDHGRTFRAVLTATRPGPNQSVHEVRSFEVPSATDWSFGHIGTPFSPQLFTDINTTLDQKIEALQAYDGEMRPFPHPRSPEAIRAQATRWGSVAGVGAAEAFEIVRRLEP